MNRRYRKTIIAGNWKMHKTPSETRQLIDELKPLISKAKWCEVVLCVPYVDIPIALRALKDSPRIAVGAQNMHHEESGAYTGDVSAAMLKDLGVKYVIIGHSERRAYYHETDTLVSRKVHLALRAGLRPIVCVGETLEQRDQGVTLDLITVQVKAALSGVPVEKLRQIVFAYEPIWAIGTGRTATVEQAGEVGASIRATIRKMYGARAARSVTIQYGGSMTASNAHDLLAQLDVDGGLVGGASLKASSFAAIVQAANQ
ncbi:MAG: triose-phosphate isomerase [Oscillospiraceae bacterium]|jgi:triosephosphate isomerase|nr:triose-phosphate isomerase [Oscillospiraceae bacterium]